MLGEEDLNPRGFHRWPEGGRLVSMMAPSIALWPDGGCLALGSGGSNRLRTAILQVLLNFADFGLSLEEAVTAQRIHVEGSLANAERGYGPDALSTLRGFAENVVEWPELNLFFGGVHAVARGVDGRFDAAGDPRRAGAALIG
jgi:gamma-glutamyltranspeptidase/glutathione hydrolase